MYKQHVNQEQKYYFPDNKEYFIAESQIERELLNLVWRTQCVEKSDIALKEEHMYLQFPIYSSYGSIVKQKEENSNDFAKAALDDFFSIKLLNAGYVSIYPPAWGDDGIGRCKVSVCKTEDNLASRDLGNILEVWVGGTNTPTLFWKFKDDWFKGLGLEQEEMHGTGSITPTFYAT